MLNSIRCYTVGSFVQSLHILKCFSHSAEGTLGAFRCSLVLHELPLTGGIMQGISCTVLSWNSLPLYNYELTVEHVCLIASTATWLISCESPTEKKLKQGKQMVGWCIGLVGPIWQNRFIHTVHNIWTICQLCGFIFSRTQNRLKLILLGLNIHEWIKKMPK